MTGTLSPTVPTIGDPNSTEDADVRSAIITLRDGLNAVLTSANVLDGATMGASTVNAAAMADNAIANAEVISSAGIEQRKLKNFLAPVTALPATPVDGDMCVFQSTVMEALGVAWLLRYRSGSSSSYKWEFIGGSPLVNEVLTEESTASGTYVALTTPGPLIALPLAGDYDVTIGCQTKPANGGWLYMGYDIGGTAAVDADALQSRMVDASQHYAHLERTRRKTGLTAVTLTAKYKSGSATINYFERTMRVRPVRVG